MPFHDGAGSTVLTHTRNKYNAGYHVDGTWRVLIGCKREFFSPAGLTIREGRCGHVSTNSGEVD